jgi:glycosyltransferase involved in cell wall biosynthesis
MKIAQVAPLFESVPPKGYGGTERVVAHLTDALVQAGHDVTLYASGDSNTLGKLVPGSRNALRLDPMRPNWHVWHTMMLDRVLADALAYDVIHFHVDILHMPLARACPRPCLTTLHGRLDLPDLPPFYEHFREHPVVSISDAQRLPLPNANWCATIAHGLPIDRYAFHRRPQDYFAFVGRISPEKRLDRAIDIATACATRLRVAAKVDPADQSYFEHEIRPLLDNPLVEWIGEIGDAQKNDFIGNARALLFPIDWPEPFGLVMIEAFACGTPVIAYDRGSVPEVVEHGATGFIVRDLDEAVAAARRLHEIDRHRCRSAFEERFTAQAMASRYLEVYARLGAGQAGSAQESAPNDRSKVLAAVA